MTSVLQSPYTSEQMAVWIRGLLMVAWADGNFDAEEQKLISSLTQNQVAPTMDLGSLEPITADELAAAFKQDARSAEDFLRTAVMVAVADGVYSSSEDELLFQFCEALGQQPKALSLLRQTLIPTSESEISADSDKGAAARIRQRDVLRPVRVWLDGLEIHDPRLARFLCKMIPAQCPFERDVKLFGHKIVHIPPLCKLNPIYEQLVGLRFRALSYLADDCGEDVSPYC
ncbi:nitrogenase [Coleofasciculus sp. FACHB-64]|uniref:Mo-dependent nitrogenase C-terminal domain-containing protein n=1 Tax=Cyanophyceae TaxID=3028117 RepID=UPI001689BBEA|nr:MULTISPECIES: Mo-dependent nitrogenase C-terminal domain-containing protein [unclassified Coleofasciculus]MBD1880034.1 nitrogenase [Coleofasciculus sp. FACHB-T130]MBD1890411.1 nitrogenase [Coleofasciculus sp. FACHB-SPT9]MBD1894214.1 nitrogenase [Coleofasciculus sp. FACHB-129]MBD1941737.1 nitrogenase [Coleofasciculus sp. FACHB-712]MBD2047523.1 nitrogenase [Coleofasciculus sp. FACHB-64]